MRPGARILDVGCGWGGFLLAVRERQGVGVGLTISRKQAEACWRAGLDVELRDWRELNPSDVAAFDGVVSVGAFEHFCSEQDHIAGRQEEIYRSFFRRCSDVLREGGRLFLQTMTWGRKVPVQADIRLDAPRGSDEHVLALLREFYGASGWLPTGTRQIEETARPDFRLVEASNGRLDYVETIEQWGRRIARPTLAKARLVATMLIRSVRDAGLRNRIRSYFAASNQECFRRGLMDHYRLVFEKRST
jgi:cyclopropane-fatty-acyl-phospholipid synthase